MPDRDFEALSKSLLERGVSPRFTSRIAAELKDHYADLERELHDAGRSADEAAAEARARLGEDALIAGELLRRPELRAWMYRSPWLTRVLFALLAAAAVVLEPPRVIAANGGLLVRYFAATCAALFVTAALLLAQSLVLRSPWIAVDGRAGAAASAGEAEGPLRIVRVGDAVLQMRVEALELAGAEPPPTPSEPRAPRRPSADERGPDIGDYEAVAAEPFGGPVVDLRPSADDLAPRMPVLSDGEYLPIVKVAPVYPPRAASLGIEGYVIVEFTVTPAGGVSDVTVVESSSELFHDAALEATHQFKYKPRVVSGQAVAVSGVRNKITFVLGA